MALKRWGIFREMSNKELFAYTKSVYEIAMSKKLTLRTLAKWLLIRENSINPYRQKKDTIDYRELPLYLKRLIFFELKFLTGRKASHAWMTKNKAKVRALLTYKRWEKENRTLNITTLELIEIFEKGFLSNCRVSIINKKIPVSIKNIKLT